MERGSIRILSRRYKKTKNTITKIIHKVTATLADSVTVAERFRPLWSGVLVVDGKVIRVYDQLAKKLDHARFTENEIKWLHKMSWLCGIDYGTGDLPHYEIADSESRIDLIMYFKTIKNLNYPLKAVVCDGNPEITAAVRFVYGHDVIIQRCTRHFVQELKRLVVSQEDDQHERLKLEQLVLQIQKIIEADQLADTVDDLKQLSIIYRQCSSPIKLTIMTLFEQTKKELIAHLLFPHLNLPHTSNDIENLFKQLSLRLKSVGRFYKCRYARDYLNSWALLRRFTPFTDCRGHRKSRNGHAPLELAGVIIKNINPLKLQK